MNRKLKAGVRTTGVSVEILFAVWVAEAVFEQYAPGKQFCITSLTDGRHSNDSRHHCGQGVDLRKWYLPEDKLDEIVGIIQHRLGDAYFVLLEATHIHIQHNA